MAANRHSSCRSRFFVKITGFFVGKRRAGPPAPIFFTINRSRRAPEDDGAVGAALAHNGHPCGGGHSHGLRDIRDHHQQNVPCNGMKRQHPPGIAALARKQHCEMDPDRQYHGEIHGQDGREHIVLIGRHRRDRSPSSQSPAAIHIPPTAPRIYHRMCFSSVIFSNRDIFPQNTFKTGINAPEGAMI